MSTTIPIVLISDDNYMIPTIVTIQSIKSNRNFSNNYRIYIITTECSEENARMIEELNDDNFKVSLMYVSLEKFQELGNERGEYCQATKAALFKFEIPNLLTQYDKVIYIDGDIIVRKDLLNLYKSNLGDNYVGAVGDSAKIYSGREIVKKCDKYFNSGVMVLNLKLLRKDNIPEKLYRQKQQMKDMTLMDQDVFNIVLNPKVKLLPIKYNFLYINLLRAEQNKKVSIMQINEMYNTKYSSLADIRKDSVIIHFSSKNKPWKDPCVKLADEWKTYFAQSPASEKKEWLNNQSISWLLSENKKMENMINKLNKEQRRKDQEIRKLMYSLDQIWKSKSFKCGRFITFFPRKFRILFNRYKEKFASYKKYAQLRKIPQNALNTDPRENKIIVSLTSYSKRMSTLDIVIATLLRQTMKPDKIVLTLTESDYRNKMTKQLKKLENKGLIEIITCEDSFQSPHKKYYFSMQKYSEDIIITVDDDIEYRADLIEVLYSSYIKFPTSVSALRTHRIRFDKEGNILPYDRWKLRESSYVLIPRHDLFATGCGGVLYPPHILYGDLFDIEKIKDTCFMADDIWLKFMELLGDVKVVLASKQEPLTYVNGTQENGLFNTNVNNNENDLQMNRLLKLYSESQIIDIIKEKVL